MKPGKRRTHWTCAAIGLASLVSVVAVTDPATAQERPDEEGEICITIGHLWGGSSTDVARIAAQPVPDSFRKSFLAGGCERFQLIVGSLLEWHLAFGDETTTRAALEFLKQGMLPDRDYSADLARRIAATGFLKAPKLESRGAKSEKEKHEHFLKLVGVGRTDIELAELYLRAAEFYGSSALLARAEHYALPALEVHRLRELQPSNDREPGGQAKPLAALELYEGQADALEMHLAIVRATVNRDPAHIAAADAVLTAKKNPLFDTAGEDAYTHGDDFCDIGDRDDLRPYFDACREGNFGSMAQTWLRMRAQLDILKGSISEDAEAARNLMTIQSVWNLLRIIAARRVQENEAPRSMARYGGSEAEIILRLARVDALVRQADKLPSGNDFGNGRRSVLQLVMTELISIEPLATPSETPGRFRQVATRFLDAYAAALSLQQKEQPGANDLAYPMLDRKAAYFRTTLPRLKTIAEARAS